MTAKTKSLEEALAIEAQTVHESENIERKQKFISTPHGISSEEHLHRYNKAIFSWSAPQYVQHQKSKRWYLIAGSIAGISALVAFLLGDWTLTLAIGVFAGVYYYLQEHHPPQNIHITISEMGIKVGDEMYPFSHIKAFWLIYHPPLVKTLNLRLHKKYAHDIVIQLVDEDPVAIRRFLCGEIAEWEGKNEHLSDIILRLLKL